jgi:hypothetical protein
MGLPPESNLSEIPDPQPNKAIKLKPEIVFEGTDNIYNPVHPHQVSAKDPPTSLPPSTNPNRITP